MLDWQFRLLVLVSKEFKMNWDIVQGNWKHFKGKIKAEWGKLTDDHIDEIAGKRDELAGTLQRLYGVTKDEAELQVRRFEAHNKDDSPEATH